MKTLKAQWLAEHGNFCDTGIEEFLIPALTTAIGSGAAEVAAPIITDVGLGAAGGAGLGALTGEGAGKGALGGAITGGTIGAAGPVLGTLAGDVGLPASIAPVAGDIAAGAVGGTLGGAATGQPLGTSALGGAAAGGVAGLGAPTATPAPGAGSVPGPGAAGGGVSPTASALPGGPPPGFVGADLGAANTGAFLDATGNQAYVGTSTLGGGAYTPGTPAGGLSPSQEVAGDVAAAAPGGISPATQDIISSFPAAQTGTSSGIDSIISKLGANPGILASAGLLGIEAMRQNKPLPEQATLNQIGAQQAQQGAQLSSYLSTGTLPPGANEAINLATASAKAQIRSTAAQLGLSGSTWESDRLGQIDQQAAAHGEQIATQLLAQGRDYTQLSEATFENLLKETLSQDQAFSQALSNFAIGLGGGRLAQSTGTAA